LARQHTRRQRLVAQTKRQLNESCAPLAPFRHLHAQIGAVLQAARFAISHLKMQLRPAAARARMSALARARYRVNNPLL
jgi:hypothetical protein